MKKFACPKCGKIMTLAAVAPSGKRRWECRGGSGERTYCYSTTSPGTVARTKSGRSNPKFKRVIDSKRYIVTAAQNGTPVHKEFLASLLVACKHLKAELIVIPLRYKNPTSRWTASQANEESWAPELLTYLFNVRKKLNPNLVLLADIKVQPTASSPLTGFDSITHSESGILGHTKLQFRSVPTPQNKMAKAMTTTGACTVPNYTDSKAGRLGAFHHTLGACMVEIDGRKFHLRQINADKQTGEFIDLVTAYSPQGCKPAGPALALVMGDTHVDFIDPKVKKATFDKGGMIDVLKPKHIVFHDLNDDYAINPHHNGNPFNAIAKIRGNRADARAEMERAFEFVKNNTPPNTKALVVASNHDNFLGRWIVSQDWRTAPGNAEFYLETALAMVRSTSMTEKGTDYPCPFIYWGEKYFQNDPLVRFLRMDESFTLAGVEMGMHGHAGPNGARGSIKNLRRIGVKSIIGHTHSPGIEEGCYQVGTSTRLSAEYTQGPSGWLNTHCVLYANGKRSLITIINGEWKL